MLLKRHPNRPLTKVYGIYGELNARRVQSINDYAVKMGSDFVYVPQRRKQRIYFTSAIEALKVAEYLKSENKTLDYHIFVTSLESLERVKNIYKNDEELQNKNPLFSHRQINYKIYNSAQEYFDARNLQNLKETNENDLTK